MTLNNLHFFNLSKNHPESTLDDFYIFAEPCKNIDEYIKNAKEIKDILITIKTLKKSNESESIIEKYYQKLSKSINKNSNTSEFSCFINACDNTIDGAKKEIETLRAIVEKYFNKRILSEAVPTEWVQALIDNNSSRKKGKCGENKLIFILNNLGFNEVDSLESLKIHNFAVLRFSNKINLKTIRKNFNLEIKTKTQNKNLDLIIKVKNKIFLCEAKHLNTGGGGQDKQISELIELINLKEESENIHFIAFLDGKYSNNILQDEFKSPKLITQRGEIIRNLENNPRNFWLNSFGFEALFKAFKF